MLTDKVCVERNAFSALAVVATADNKIKNSAVVRTGDRDLPPVILKNAKIRMKKISTLHLFIIISWECENRCNFHQAKPQTPSVFYFLALSLYITTVQLALLPPVQKRLDF